MYRIDFWTLWEKARVGWFKRTTSKHVYYLGWNRSPAQVGCMRQVLGPGALGRPRGIGRRGRCEGGSGWGIHVKPWLILVNVWQKRLQYCKVISLQLKKKKEYWGGWLFPSPGHHLNPGIKLTSPVWQDYSLPLSHPGRPKDRTCFLKSQLFKPSATLNYKALEVLKCSVHLYLYLK